MNISEYLRSIYVTMKAIWKVSNGYQLYIESIESWNALYTLLEIMIDKDFLPYIIG